MAHGCGLFVKGGKTNHKAYLQVFPPPRLSIQNIYKTVVSLLKEVLSQLWNRSREHESNSIKSVTYSQVICLCGRAWFENLLPVFYLVCVPGLQPGDLNDF